MRIVVLFALFLLLPAAGRSISMSAPQVAEHEARAFLQLIDQERFSDAWYVGDAYLQAQLSLPKWRRMLRSYRVPLGEVRSRRRTVVRHLDGLENAAPGLYVEVKFRTRFTAVERNERVVVHRGEDSRWRVASYQLW